MARRTHKPVVRILNLLIFSLLLSSINLQTYEANQVIVSTSPIVTDSGAIENKSVCFADCKSCQTKTGDCETCFAPWFELRSGKCELAYPEYKLESTEEEQRFVNFIPSSEWSSDGLPVPTKQCKPDPNTFSKNFVTIGPFSTGTVTYQRTISRHNYFGIKFLLLLFNWTQPDTSIQIITKNQADLVLFNTTISLANNQIKLAEMDNLCSGAPLDRKVSIDMKRIQEQSSQLKIQFISKMPLGASWGLSSFVLITGLCNSKCAVCTGYTPKVDGCSKCKNFLANNVTGGEKCSTCLSGFVLDDKIPACMKCPIEYKQCKLTPPPNIVCEYANISNSAKNCTFISGVYFDRKQIFQQTFFSSLYSIQGRGAFVTKCGMYSIVGPANFGDIISRTFLELPPHIQISLNFNIFIFQQKQQNQNYTIAVLVNGKQFPIPPVQKSIIVTATSNECDLTPVTISTERQFEALKTFEIENFLNNTQIQQVTIGVSLGTFSSNPATKWGIRDMRLVFKRCDENCDVCSEGGCQKCKGFFQLSNFSCLDCIIGTGNNQTAGQCQPCPPNCQQCMTKPTKSQKPTQLTCTKCYSGFYLFTLKQKTSCQKNANLGNPSPIISTPSNCSITIPGDNNNTRFLNFSLSQNNKIVRGIQVVSPMVGKNIKFNLLKIDNWDGDMLEIYANDLLIKRIVFGNLGGLFCGNPAEGDQLSFQEFYIVDNSPNLKLQFQAISKTSKQRRFGISNLQVYPVGCIGCQNYNFTYILKYNYDQRLYAQMSFNLVYQSQNQQDFKNTFIMKIGNRQLNYDIISNDSIRYWLRSEMLGQGEIVNKNFTVQCLYPQRVTANIPELGAQFRFNQDQFFGTRLLQESNSNYQNKKPLDINSAGVMVDRYTPIQEREESLIGLQIFFNVLTRIVIYLGFVSFFLGCQTPCTHLMHTFQKIWVHIYVASLALSPILKTALVGFRECQDQNIAINPDQWQSGLPKYLYYDAPAQYQQYYKDITFFRNIYNVGVAVLILTVIYFVMRLIMSKFNKNNNSFFRHLRTVFTHRPIFYFNSIFFYQYFTVLLACCLQFLDLKTRTNEPVFAGVNAAACIIAFIFATLYPIFFHILIHIKRKNVLLLLGDIMGNNRNKDFSNHQRDLELLEEEHVVYNNRYSEIFFRFMPKQLWNQSLGESQMIGQKHIFYNLFRFGDLWWHAILVIFGYQFPFAQVFLLILTNGFHFIINAFSNLNTTKYFKILKCLQLLFFIIVQILIIVMLSLLQTLRTQSYQTIGIVSVIFIFFILVVSFTRFFYTAYRLYLDYDPKGEDQRMVRRRDAAYNRGWITK